MKRLFDFLKYAPSFVVRVASKNDTTESSLQLEEYREFVFANGDKYGTKWSVNIGVRQDKRTEVDLEFPSVFSRIDRMRTAKRRPFYLLQATYSLIFRINQGQNLRPDEPRMAKIQYFFEPASAEDAFAVQFSIFSYFVKSQLWTSRFLCNQVAFGQQKCCSPQDALARKNQAEMVLVVKLAPCIFRSQRSSHISALVQQHFSIFFYTDELLALAFFFSCSCTFFFYAAVRFEFGGVAISNTTRFCILSGAVKFFGWVRFLKSNNLLVVITI